MYGHNNNDSHYKYAIKKNSPNQFALASNSDVAEMDFAFDCNPDCNNDNNGALPMFPVQRTLPTARSETPISKSRDHGRESSSPISMRNRQRRREQQKQQQHQQPSLSPTRRRTASPTYADTATTTSTTNANASNSHGRPVTVADSPSPTKQSTRMSRNKSNHSTNNNNRLDMRYDDDEFAFTAHLIMHHLEQQSREEHEDAGCVNWNDFHQLWNYIQAGDESQSSVGGGGHQQQQQRPPPADRADTPLTEDLLAEFQFALKHRLKYIPLISPSNNDKQNKEEEPIVVLTRQVAKLIAKSGFPEPKRPPRRDSSRRRDTTNDKDVGDMDDSTTIDTERSSSISAPVNIPTSEPEKDANKNATATAPVADSGYATPAQPGLPASSTQAQNYQHPQPGTFDLQLDHAEYIRQQYQRELQEQLQPQSHGRIRNPCMKCHHPFIPILLSMHTLRRKSLPSPFWILRFIPSTICSSTQRHFRRNRPYL
ncbi:hypothetical protein MHU86_2431 [Fragilaria crotonensis]|nr:hypothetical protein MHU86_2431 [Fragilaria crotonensis]